VANLTISDLDDASVAHHLQAAGTFTRPCIYPAYVMFKDDPCIVSKLAVEQFTLSSSFSVLRCLGLRGLGTNRSSFFLYISHLNCRI